MVALPLSCYFFTWDLPFPTPTPPPPLGLSSVSFRKLSQCCSWPTTSWVLQVQTSFSLCHWACIFVNILILYASWHLSLRTLTSEVLARATSSPSCGLGMSTRLLASWAWTSMWPWWEPSPHRWGRFADSFWLISCQNEKGVIRPNIPAEEEIQFLEVGPE